VGALIAVIADPGEDISALTAAAPAPAPVAAPAVPAGQPAPAGAVSERPAAVPPPPRSEDPATAAAPAAPSPGARSVPVPPRAAASPTPIRPAVTPVPPAPPSGPAAPGRLRASPLARKIAAQAGVDLALVQGSGPGGRIVRRDVEAATAGEAAPAAAAATAEYEDRPLTPIRAAIARRMPLAKAPVPHFYLTAEVAMDRAWQLREELNALEGGTKISLNDFVVRACALALVRHPEVNASFQGESIRVYRRAHVGIAVALDDGLITPVLRDCDEKPLARIAEESRDLVERARARKLRAPELSGATFSISNLGMLGVAEFSAIINPPEGAILAVGAVRRLPVVGADDSVRVGRRLALTLSCDHRVMDGAMGARFLQTVTRLLEEPLRLLV
jgi:pyruvate dehydrogenase E2 component (dihydrolipoamide acetyltransferase)